MALGMPCSGFARHPDRHRGGVPARFRRGASLALVVLLGLAPGPRAAAFEFFDDRIEVHGYFEEQFRTLAANFDPSNGWDVSQWYTVLNVETDLHIAPDGFGPFDLVDGFVRLEARFDCIWSHGCGMFPAVNAYGNRAEKFPDRISSAVHSGYTGAVVTGDTRRIHGIPVDELGEAFKDLPHAGDNKPAFIWHVPGVSTLFGVPGEDGITGTTDDPAFYVFGRFVEPGQAYRFGLRQVRGAMGGSDLQVLGPFLPKNTIDPLGSVANIANPFNPLDVNPNTERPGSTAMPYRPAPRYAAGFGAPNGQGQAARGLFIPNEAVAKMIEKSEFGPFDQNYSENELQWNIGASQQDERELKEAYLDIEMFDNRLWIRAGKQNIVWGKTELFRTTDQFNPQDLALATLPSLEESRIALWSARGVYSFYSVGPLDDVRLELAFNFDQMEPTDLGRCGEPYTPNPVCNKTAGLFAHGLAGFALPGEIRPEDPWDGVKGLEFGGRLEFRWNRFSFAISDFYGYDDFPYVDPIFYYSRNVDPRTGRPRTGQSEAGCDPDGLYGGDTSGCLTPENALEHHHANQQRFALICASSVGFSDLDRSVCAQSVLNSNLSVLTSTPDQSPTITEALGTIFSGSPAGRALVRAQFIDLAPFPSVELNKDPGDGPGQGTFPNSSIAAVLTDQQEALLGCGAFWHTSCDVSLSTGYGGVDLLNAELSVLMQSAPGFPGTSGTWISNTGPDGVIQPGTVRDCDTNPVGCGGRTGYLPFEGGAVASRYEGGRRYTLPGARSPFPEAGALRQGPVPYDPLVDGCVTNTLGIVGCENAHPLVHPFSGDLFQSELAAFSYNFLLTFAVLSGLGKEATAACPPGTLPQDSANCFLSDEFIPSDPERRDGCSYARLELCSNISALYSIAHTTRRDVRAGGNGSYGRVDSDWHQAGTGVLRYQKRNVFGFSMDFAEDFTKSNWSLESTWIEGNPFEDNDEYDRLSYSDTLNLTISVDRPTFINFLNRGRTFFFNTQWFFQYIPGYHGSFTDNGPVNVLATFFVETGYFRDRLNMGITFVYDFNSNSGAILPQVSYRFTENFSVILSANTFMGRFERQTPPLRSVNDFPYRGGRHQNTDYTEQGLSPVRFSDEVAIVLRYTF